MSLLASLLDAGDATGYLALPVVLPPATTPPRPAQEVPAADGAAPARAAARRATPLVTRVIGGVPVATTVAGEPRQLPASEAEAAIATLLIPAPRALPAAAAASTVARATARPPTTTGRTGVDHVATLWSRRRAASPAARVVPPPTVPEPPPAPPAIAQVAAAASPLPGVAQLAALVSALAFGPAPAAAVAATSNSTADDAAAAPLAAPAAGPTTPSRTRVRRRSPPRPPTSGAAAPLSTASTKLASPPDVGDATSVATLRSGVTVTAASEASYSTATSIDSLSESPPISAVSLHGVSALFQHDIAVPPAVAQHAHRLWLGGMVHAPPSVWSAYQRLLQSCVEEGRTSLLESAAAERAARGELATEAATASTRFADLLTAYDAAKEGRARVAAAALPTSGGEDASSAVADLVRLAPHAAQAASEVQSRWSSLVPPLSPQQALSASASVATHSLAMDSPASIGLPPRRIALLRLSAGVGSGPAAAAGGLHSLSPSMADGAAGRQPHHYHHHASAAATRSADATALLGQSASLALLTTIAAYRHQLQHQVAQRQAVASEMTAKVAQMSEALSVMRASAAAVVADVAAASAAKRQAQPSRGFHRLVMPSHEAGGDAAPASHEVHAAGDAAAAEKPLSRDEERRCRRQLAAIADRIARHDVDAGREARLAAVRASYETARQSLCDEEVAVIRRLHDNAASHAEGQLQRMRERQDSEIGAARSRLEVAQQRYDHERHIVRLKRAAHRILAVVLAAVEALTQQPLEGPSPSRTRTATISPTSTHRPSASPTPSSRSSVAPSVVGSRRGSSARSPDAASAAASRRGSAMPAGAAPRGSLAPSRRSASPVHSHRPSIAPSPPRAIAIPPPPPPPAAASAQSLRVHLAGMLAASLRLASYHPALHHQLQLLALAQRTGGGASPPTATMLTTDRAAAAELMARVRERWQRALEALRRPPAPAAPAIEVPPVAAADDAGQVLPAALRGRLFRRFRGDAAALPAAAPVAMPRLDATRRSVAAPTEPADTLQRASRDIRVSVADYLAPVMTSEVAVQCRVAALLDGSSADSDGAALIDALHRLVVATVATMTAGAEGRPAHIVAALASIVPAVAAGAPSRLPPPPRPATSEPASIPVAPKAASRAPDATAAASTLLAGDGATATAVAPAPAATPAPAAAASDAFDGPGMRLSAAMSHPADGQQLQQPHAAASDSGPAPGRRSPIPAHADASIVVPPPGVPSHDGAGSPTATVADAGASATPPPQLPPQPSEVAQTAAPPPPTPLAPVATAAVAPVPPPSPPRDAPATATEEAPAEASTDIAHTAPSAGAPPAGASAPATSATARVDDVFDLEAFAASLPHLESIANGTASPATLVQGARPTLPPPLPLHVNGRGSATSRPSPASTTLQAAPPAPARPAPLPAPTTTADSLTGAVDVTAKPVTIGALRAAAKGRADAAVAAPAQLAPPAKPRSVRFETAVHVMVMEAPSDDAEGDDSTTASAAARSTPSTTADSAARGASTPTEPRPLAAGGTSAAAATDTSFEVDDDTAARRRAAWQAVLGVGGGGGIVAAAAAQPAPSRTGADAGGSSRRLVSMGLAAQHMMGIAETGESESDGSTDSSESRVEVEWGANIRRASLVGVDITVPDHVAATMAALDGEGRSGGAATSASAPSATPRLSASRAAWEQVWG